jgi:hypothetical protein
LAGGALYANLGAGVFLVSSATILTVFFVSFWLSSRPLSQSGKKR